MYPGAERVTLWARLCFLKNALCPKYLYVLWRKKKEGVKAIEYLHLSEKPYFWTVLFCFFPLGDVKNSKVSDHTKENLTGFGSFFLFFFLKPLHCSFPNFLNYKAYNMTFLVLMIRKYLLIHVWRNMHHGVHTEVGQLCGVGFPFCPVTSRNQAQATRLSSTHPSSPASSFVTVFLWCLS